MHWLACFFDFLKQGRIYLRHLNTMDPAYNEFGYNEHAALRAIFSSVKNTSDWHQCLKSLGTTSAPYNEHIFTVRNKVAKIVFLHLSVILFTGGGVCLSACWDTTTPREQTPPRTRHPPGADTPPDQQTATVADGTHPIGMHSCYESNCPL